MIDWDSFFQYFCRRGMLRQSETALRYDVPARFAKKVIDCDHVPINERYPFIEDDDGDKLAK